MDPPSTPPNGRTTSRFDESRRDGSRLAVSRLDVSRPDVSRPDVSRLDDSEHVGSVPGFELVELLAVGERAEVYRARPSPDAAEVLMGRGRHLAEAAGVMGVVGSRRDVAVKVFAPGVRPPLDEREVLAERPIAAMPELIGETTTRDGCAVLVLTFCPEPSLRIRAATTPHQQRRPDALGPGDAPLVELVESLHRAGWAHGGIEAGSVLVGEDGRLTLVGFGGATPHGDPAFEGAVVADLRAARALGPLLTPGERADGAVSITAPGRPPSDGGVQEWDWDDEPEVVDVGEVRFVETVEPALLAVTESAVALRELVRQRGRSLVRGRGRRIAVGVAVALVTMAAIWLTLPPPREAVSAGAGTSAPATPSTSPLASAGGGQPTASVGQPSASIGHSSASIGQPSASVADSSLLEGDDPVAAAGALLRLRDACLRAADAGCLGDVDQWGSPAEEADRVLLAQAATREGDPTASSNAQQVRLVQRVGGVALLEVVGGSIGGVTGDAADGASGDVGAQTKPVPLLVIRGGTGWRIRSFGDDP